MLHLGWSTLVRSVPVLVFGQRLPYEIVTTGDDERVNALVAECLPEPHLGLSTLLGIPPDGDLGSMRNRIYAVTAQRQP